MRKTEYKNKYILLLYIIVPFFVKIKIYPHFFTGQDTVFLFVFVVFFYFSTGCEEPHAQERNLWIKRKRKRITLLVSKDSQAIPRLS